RRRPYRSRPASVSCAASWLQVLTVKPQPVRGDASLDVGQRELPRADPVVEQVLKLVLLVKAGRWSGRLRPEVEVGVVPAQVEGDEVVKLVGAGPLRVAEAVLRVDLEVLLAQHVSNGARVAGGAHLLCRDACEDL